MLIIYYHTERHIPAANAPSVATVKLKELKVLNDHHVVVLQCTENYLDKRFIYSKNLLAFITSGPHITNYWKL